MLKNPYLSIKRDCNLVRVGGISSYPRFKLTKLYCMYNPLILIVNTLEAILESTFINETGLQFLLTSKLYPSSG